MKTSESINELAAALAKAQAEIKNAAFNKVNPHFKNKYADLSAVRDAVTAPLAKHGISIAQGMEPSNGHLIVATRLMHSSGQWLESGYPIINDTSKPQVMGSALTYARRYSLSAICNIASEEDDDAEAASKTNGNGSVSDFPKGNAEVKYYKSEAKTPGAVKAQDNNAFYKQLEREIDDIPTKAQGRAWKAMREQDFDEKVGPEAMLLLSERYEAKMATLP